MVVVLGVLMAIAACSSSATVPSDAASSVPASSAAASAGPSGAAGSAEAEIVRAGEPWIAFQQFAGKSTVMLVRPDGSGLHSPTAGVAGGDQTNPDWSPDGSQLVFVVASGSTEVLWVVDADGSGARLLADCQEECLWVDDPDWSPDGESVLFSRVSEGADGAVIATLERIDVATGAVRVLVQAAAEHFYAGQRWSPDGNSVVLEVVSLAGATIDSDVDDVSLAIIDVASPTPAGRELIGSGRFPETAAWAPDGSEIVFAALEQEGSSSGTDLYAIRPDGSGLRRITTLTDDGGSATHPEVTADGTSIVFVATRSGSGESGLGQVDIGGGEITPATGAGFLDGAHPRMRPQP
jgi:Tol biopolymer transport system component